MSEPVLIGMFHAWDCDHYGHVNSRAYAGLFDDAISAFWSGIGAALSGIVPVTAQMLTRFQSEALPGTSVRIEVSVLRLGNKSAVLLFSMSDPSRVQLATCEVVEVFFDTTSRKSAEIPEAIRSALEAVIAHPQ